MFEPSHNDSPPVTLVAKRPGRTANAASKDRCLFWCARSKEARPLDVLSFYTIVDTELIQTFSVAPSRQSNRPHALATAVAEPA